MVEERLHNGPRRGNHPRGDLGYKAVLETDFSVQDNLSIERYVCDERPSPSYRIAYSRDDEETFTVPTSKLFVLTALGSDIAASSTNFSLFVDGVRELQVRASGGGTGGSWDRPSVKPVAPGFTVSAGSTIEAVGNGARAWGYLVDQ